VKRTFVYLACLVGMAGAAYLAGEAKSQGLACGPPGAPPAGAGAGAPAATGGRDVAVFNVAKVMKDFQKWQFFANEMNKVRAAETAELAKMGETLAKMKAQIEAKDTPTATREALEKQYKDLSRQYQDKSDEVRRRIDEQSSKHLKELHDDIKVVVEAVANKNGFGVVFAYPDATTEEEKKSPLYFELKLRPPAALPFFVSQNCDITEAVVQTLNKYRPAPGPIATTGGTTAGSPAPGTPGGGTVPVPGGGK
jgi:Skp family chaperone for outer membrane proteins